MAKTKQKKQVNNTKKAMLFSFLTILGFSFLWGILYYFIALPNYIGILQYVVAFVVYQVNLKDNKKCHLWLILWCLGLNLLTLFVAIIVGIYAETSNFANTFENFALLVQNSKHFTNLLTINIVTILASVLISPCLILSYFKIKKANQNKTVKAKKPKLEKQKIDCFVELFTTTKTAVENFLANKNELEFKKAIFGVEQKVASLKTESLLSIKSTLNDALSIPSSSASYQKSLTILKKIVDKY